MFMPGRRQADQAERPHSFINAGLSGSSLNFFDPCSRQTRHDFPFLQVTTVKAEVRRGRGFDIVIFPIYCPAASESSLTVHIGCLATTQE